MLAFFRRHVSSWPARILFMVLVAAFGLWGIADVVRNIGTDDTAVANVAGHKITPQELDGVYRRQLAQVTQMMGSAQEPTPEIRREIAQQSLDQLITQAAVAVEVDRLGLKVPDADLRKATFAIPAFRGPSGSFDRATFNNVLANNNLTEARFLDLMRGDLAGTQLVQAVAAGVRAPDVLTNRVYQIQHETRAAQTALFPFASAKPPATPDDATLQRWYENHPDRFSSPEFRHVKAVLLSPETLAKTIQVTDAQIQAAYDRNKDSYVTPEKRSVEVILTQDQTTATQLADQWRAGADWAAMQAAATAHGASAVELDDAGAGEFPAAALGQAVFASAPGTVPPPVHSELGWHVLKVTKVTPGLSRSLADVRDELRQQIALAEAGDQVEDRVTKVQDALAGNGSLDDLPGDLGLAAVQGTLDAQGNTPEGTPAPIPGTPDLRRALIAAAFQASKGDAPHLAQAGAHAYFAVVVDSITPAARQPYDKVADRVLADWQADQRRREENIAATKLMTDIQGGESFANAALVAGVTPQPTPPITAGNPPASVPRELVGPLFGMKQGEVTEVETATGFIVAQLSTISIPDPKSDPAGIAQASQAMTQSIGNDIQAVFTAALRVRAKPSVNQSLLDSVAQQ